MMKFRALTALSALAAASAQVAIVRIDQNPVNVTPVALNLHVSRFLLYVCV